MIHSPWSIGFGYIFFALSIWESGLARVSWDRRLNGKNWTRNENFETCQGLGISERIFSFTRSNSSFSRGIEGSIQRMTT